MGQHGGTQAIATLAAKELGKAVALVEIGHGEVTHALDVLLLACWRLRRGRWRPRLDHPLRPQRARLRGLALLHLQRRMVQAEPVVQQRAGHRHQARIRPVQH